MCWLGRRRAGVIVNNEHRNGMDDLIQSYVGRYYLNVRLVYIYSWVGPALNPPLQAQVWGGGSSWPDPAVSTSLIFIRYILYIY